MGLSQAALARAARVASADICRIEKGIMKPYPAWAKRLARALKIDNPNALLDDVDLSIRERGRVSPDRRRRRAA